MFICIFLLTTIGMAQNVPPVNSNTDGFYLGVNFSMAGLNATDSNLNADIGTGLGAKAGYNFTQNFGVFLGLDGASINPDNRKNYGLGHLEIGAEGIFSNPAESLRPFVRASYLTITAVADDPSGDAEVVLGSNGFGLGGGVYIFPRSSFSLELSYNQSWSWGNLVVVKSGSMPTEIDPNVTSGRFFLGAAFHF